MQKGNISKISLAIIFPILGVSHFFSYKITPRDVSFISCWMEGRGGRRNAKNVPAIGKVSTHDEGDFLFPELFDGDLKRVGFAF